MKKIILTIILIALTATVGFLVASSSFTSSSQPDDATTTESTRSAPDGTHYFVTQERTTDKKGNRGAPKYAIKQKTPNASSTTLMQFADEENNRVLDWIFVADQSEVFLHRRHSVERIDLRSKEKTVIHKALDSSASETGSARCTNRVSGLTVSDDASKIVIGRSSEPECDAMNAIYTLKREPSAEYVQTDKITPNPGQDDRYDFSSWANGTFRNDGERMLTQFAGCSKGPCPPSYRVFDFTTGNWQWEDDFQDSDKRFATTDLLLPEINTLASAFVLAVGRRAPLQQCDPPIEGLPLPGEVIRLHNLQSGDTQEIVAGATDGFRLLGFTTDGSHVLLERIKHQNQNGCVENRRNTVGVSALSLKKPDEPTPVDNVKTWTQDQNTHVAYWRFGDTRELYVDGDQIASEPATFLGFARGNRLIKAADQVNTDDSGTQTYTNETYGYSFAYSADWHEENDNDADKFGIYNFKIPETADGHSRPESHNKIVGRVVDDNTYATSSVYETESMSTSSQVVADFKTKRVDVTFKSGKQTRTYYIPLRNQAGEYLSLTIYGDPENFDVLERVVDSFRFK